MTDPNRFAIVNDQPSAEDHLDFTDFSEALHHIITQSETPLTVGIFGAWGSGKSTLMKMLHDEVVAKHPPTRVVWFTAWKYDREEALWRALILRTIAALYPRENQPQNMPREERPVLQKPTDEGQQALIALLERLEESVYQDVSWDEIGERNINWWQLISNVTQVGASASAEIASLGALSLLKKWFGGDDVPQDKLQEAVNAISREIKTSHRRQLLEMERFEATFTEAVAKSFEKDKNGRLIVFVDDLDRCMPEKAIEILEAIKLFLAVPGTVFVLAADQRVIQKGIEARYGALFSQTPNGKADNLPIHGASYMQKIIQIPFHLPALSVDKLDEYIQNSMKKVSLSDMTRQVFAHGSNPNPRQIKRAISIFQLLRAIAQARQKREKLPENGIAWPLLAKTVLVQTQYPDLYQEWRNRPMLLQSLERKYSMVSRPPKQQAAGEMPVGEMPVMEPQAAENEAVEESSILAPYMGREYNLLRQMMQYPAPEETGEGEEQARFEGLTYPQMAAYVQLAGSAATGAVVIADIDSDLLAELLSGDSALIDDAAARMQQIEAARKQALPKNETLTRPEAAQLVRILENPQEPMGRRVSAGDALATIGDPRFAADRWQLPADELAGFIEIPAGAFQMGDDGEESKLHEVTLPTYYIGKYAVTTAQFRAFAEDAPYEPIDKDSLRGRDNHPVVLVTWRDAIAYCAWLTERLRQWQDAPTAFSSVQTLLQQKGKQAWRVTLPSEAEWEKAARGNDRRLYPWGNEFDADKANTKESGLGRTTAVGCFPAGASPYGGVDMSGNVWEWTRSQYKPYPYDVDDDRKKVEAGADASRVFRGGSYYDDKTTCGLARRDSLSPDLGYGGLGLRVVVSPFFTSDR